jgi:hypothetical protein
MKADKLSPAVWQIQDFRKTVRGIIKHLEEHEEAFNASEQVQLDFIANDRVFFHSIFYYAKTVPPEFAKGLFLILDSQKDVTIRKHYLIEFHENLLWLQMRTMLLEQTRPLEVTPLPDQETKSTAEKVLAPLTETITPLAQEQLENTGYAPGGVYSIVKNLLATLKYPLMLLRSNFAMLKHEIFG